MWRGKQWSPLSEPWDEPTAQRVARELSALLDLPASAVPSSPGFAVVVETAGGSALVVSDEHERRVLEAALAPPTPERPPEFRS